ncbi:hypothetical protein HMPREF1544_10445 [Mucor circinelloides 1006PhL]|uniref:Uncharacterized protein n=1 Tax=Mucor circinelloides f. circinelloides (strain 1006PhL) TaxID=1220926 RepID=S2IYG3_MUCC1|nr:hypothetical protein HMPREF1544_10445 [Mucor circinelloides 1006PhL]
MASNKENTKLWYAEVLMDEKEVVKDKFPSSPLGGIKIKGRAENQVKQERSKQTKLKQSVASYMHAKTRINVHLKTRHEKLNKLIIPTFKKDLAIIRGKHSDIHKYNTAKAKYINQFFANKHEAAAFIKKHLRSI